MADVRSPGDAPPQFAEAVRTLRSARLRPDVVVDETPPPGKLAPWTYALAGQVVTDGDEVATSRLVLLHDPDGYDQWEGTLRLVTFITAELDPEIAGDPLLAEVGWSWLLDALAGSHAPYTAAAGTVTLTSSTRFGELAGPPPTTDLELRASWTPLSEDLDPHAHAWADLTCSTAGLPPPGVALLPNSSDGRA